MNTHTHTHIHTHTHTHMYKYMYIHVKIVVMITDIGAEYGRGSARGLSQILEELTASKKLCNDKDALLQVHF